MEIWLNDVILELVNIIGYNFILNYWLFKLGGGVGIYLKNGFDYKFYLECNFFDFEVIELFFVEIIVF